MSGEMQLTVLGQRYAASPVDTLRTYTFDSSTTKLDMREQIRQMRLRFESNVSGGTYQMGRPMMKLKLGDGRP